MPPAAPPFDRDTYLLRQKFLAVQENYDVWDETGETILFIERPRLVVHSALAILGGLGVGGIVLYLTVALANAVGPGGADAVIVLLGTLAAGAAFVATAIALSPLRHLTIYRDRTKAEPILTVFQDKRFQPIVRTFTVRTADGVPLGRFRKNNVIAILRKEWLCTDPNGRPILLAQEDSPIRALLRRFLGPAFGALRTNFTFQHPDSDVVVGEFNRQLTILDRYVLDMTQDINRRIDRRVALALGVMLDTGERR